MSDQETAQRLADILEDAVREVDPTTNFSWKRMFGGAGYYANGRMFAAWFRDERLALKLADNERQALLEIEGAGQSQSKTYIEVPPAFLEDTAALATWVEKSMAYVHSLPHKKKRR